MRRSLLIAGGLAAAMVLGQGCKKHHATYCGDPYLTDVSYVGYGGIGWGGYIVDPYYNGYVYEGYGGGWFDPGDDYVPGAPEPSDGWDGDDGTYFPGADDPGSDVGDPSGGVPSDDTSGAGDGVGDDPGGGGVETMSLPLTTASDGSSNAAEQVGPNGCYTCLVGCRVGTDNGRQAVGGSSYDYASACRVAVHRVERWAHDVPHAAITDCQVLIPTPIGGADGGIDGDRTAAEASVGSSEPDAATAPDASDASPE